MHEFYVQIARDYYQGQVIQSIVSLRKSVVDKTYRTHKIKGANKFC